MPPTITDFNFTLHDKGGHNINFEAANQDLTDATYQFFGFVSSSGAWLVMRFHIIGSAIIYEYFAGKTRTTYDALWNASGVYIGTLTFTTFDLITIL